MINKQPSINVVFDRRKIATLTRQSSLEIRVCHNYKQKYISTGIMLYSNQWKKGKIVNCPNIIQVSRTLDTILANVRQAVLDMISRGEMNIDRIEEEMRSNEGTKETFRSFIEKRMLVWKYGKSKGTLKRYACFTKMFYKWNKIVQFEDVTDTKIIAFDIYLTGLGMAANSKWGNYHKFLNMLITEAVKDGLIQKNPYKWLNIDRGSGINGAGRFLTPEEFRKLKTCKLPTKSLERVRDVFVFQTYTCLSYSDLKYFDPKMIQEVKGMNVYVGNRKKTNMTFTIPLLSPTLDILHKYNGKLPIISNVKYNEYLKVVAQSSGIDKPISTHWARHTGATLLLNEGVPMQIVSKICGHSSTRITERVYAKLLDETVVDAVSSLGI